MSFWADENIRYWIGSCTDYLLMIIFALWFKLLAFLMFDNGSYNLMSTFVIGLALVQITLLMKGQNATLHLIYFWNVVMSKALLIL